MATANALIARPVLRVRARRISHSRTRSGKSHPASRRASLPPLLEAASFPVQSRASIAREGSLAPISRRRLCLDMGTGEHTHGDSMDVSPERLQALRCMVRMGYESGEHENASRLACLDIFEQPPCLSPRSVHATLFSACPWQVFNHTRAALARPHLPSVLGPIGRPDAAA